MSKSQETYNKKEKEKKRRKKKQDKLERRQQRKLEKAEQGKKTFEEQIRYVDENGNLTTEKPDPNKKKKVIKLEDIVLGAGHNNPMRDPIRKGMVKFFNDEKGYGFIVDKETKESIFVHINNISGQVQEGSKVSFEVEIGQKGPNAVRVKLQ